MAPLCHPWCRACPRCRSFGDGRGQVDASLGELQPLALREIGDRLFPRPVVARKPGVDGTRDRACPLDAFRLLFARRIEARRAETLAWADGRQVTARPRSQLSYAARHSRKRSRSRRSNVKNLRRGDANSGVHSNEELGRTVIIGVSCIHLRPIRSCAALPSWDGPDATILKYEVRPGGDAAHPPRPIRALPPCHAQHGKGARGRQRHARRAIARIFCSISTSCPRATSTGRAQYMTRRCHPAAASCLLMR